MPVRAVAVAAILAGLTAVPAIAADPTHTAFLRSLPAPETTPTLCIVDTGVTDTPITANLLAQRTSVVGGDGLDVVPGGHGSLVASVAAETFPWLRLVSVRVAAPATSILWSDVVRGINACIGDPGAGPLIVTVAIEGDSSADSGALESLAAAAGQRDITIVAAAGNNADHAASLAVLPGVVGVTGSTTSGGRCPFAPSVTTLIAATACPAAAIGTDGQTHQVTGTSFAVPQVAAVLAALRAYNLQLDAAGAAAVLTESARATNWGAVLDGHAAFRAAGLGHLVPGLPSVRVRRVLSRDNIALRVTAASGVRLLLTDRGSRRYVHRTLRLPRGVRARVVTLLPLDESGRAGVPVRIRIPSLQRAAR